MAEATEKRDGAPTVTIGGQTFRLDEVLGAIGKRHGTPEHCYMVRDVVEAALSAVERQETLIRTQARQIERLLGGVAEQVTAKADMFRDTVDRTVSKALGNITTWGVQDPETIALCMAEECGEVARAVLQARHEGGSEERVLEESEDLGALCLQMGMAVAYRVAKEQKGVG